VGHRRDVHDRILWTYLAFCVNAGWDPASEGAGLGISRKSGHKMPRRPALPGVQRRLRGTEAQTGDMKGVFDTFFKEGKR
jgi:hypothetical protein